MTGNHPHFMNLTGEMGNVGNAYNDVHSGKTIDNEKRCTSSSVSRHTPDNMDKEGNYIMHTTQK